VKVGKNTLSDLLVGEVAREKLLYYPTTTSDIFANMGRPTDTFRSGKLAADLDLPNLNAKLDRIMICGSTRLNQDMNAFAETSGLGAGSNSQLGEYVVEKAFVG
jgi:ferredoxin--NADP+ reductase